MASFVDWQNLARAKYPSIRISTWKRSASTGGGHVSTRRTSSVELQAPLSTVNYHVTELARSGLLELRGERQVRGAIEHFYSPVMRSAHRGTEGWRSQRRGQADDGSRTRDLELGKLALYQLSYVRAGADSKPARARGSGGTRTNLPSP